jgi:hypothetical protein
VEAARDIRRGHHGKQGVVVAEPPGAEAFAEVGVQINRAHEIEP